MTCFQPRIAIFSEGTSTTSFSRTAHSVFDPCEIILIGRRELKDAAFIRSLDLLVLPGVTSEDSPYGDILDESATEAIYHGLDHGLTVWLSCAAAYQFCDKISYASPSKTIGNLQGLSVFSGHARGPVDHKSPPVDESNRFSDTRVLSVTFRDAAGHDVTAGVCYGNGPAYYPPEEEQDELDVIARYADDPDRPVAIVNKRVRNGLVSFNGVLPEIALEHVWIDPAQAWRYPGIAKLRQEMELHEPSRQELIETIVRTFREHWERKNDRRPADAPRRNHP